jgi:hypothetical protein
VSEQKAESKISPCQALVRMANASHSLLIPSSLGGGGLSAPPVNLDALDTRELRDLAKGMFSDLSFLAGAVPSRLTSVLSSGVTAGSAMVAGAIDGYLGDKANIGPVGMSAAIAIGMAGFAMVTKDPDYREGAAAVARGFGAPVLYEYSKKQVETWKNKPAKPATPAAPQTPTPAAKPAGSQIA